MVQLSVSIFIHMCNISFLYERSYSSISFEPNIVYVLLLSYSLLSALKRLPKPFPDLQVQDPFRLERLRFLAAMPKGEAVSIYQSWHFQYLRINKHGKIEPEQLYCELCSRKAVIWGLLILGVNLYVIQSNGKVLEISLKNHQILNEYHIQNVSEVKNDGSLYSDPDFIPDKDVLLLADSRKNEVFTYNMTSHQKIVRIRGIPTPTSVTYSFYNNTIFYIVCAHSRHYISVYDSQWLFVRQINIMGPCSVTISPDKTIFVINSKKVSEFTLQGRFLGHVLSVSYSIVSISFSYPHLWVLKVRSGEPERFKLYDDKNVHN